MLLAISLMIAWYMLAWRPVFEDTVHDKMYPLNVLLFIPFKIYALYQWIAMQRRESNHVA